MKCALESINDEKKSIPTKLISVRNKNFKGHCWNKDSFHVGLSQNLTYHTNLWSKNSLRRSGNLAFFFESTNLSCGVHQSDGKEEVGISTSRVNPQVPEDWGQEGGEKEHASH